MTSVVRGVRALGRGIAIATPPLVSRLLSTIMPSPEQSTVELICASAWTEWVTLSRQAKSALTRDCFAD
jgi:hypothetical protein